MHSFNSRRHREHGLLALYSSAVISHFDLRFRQLTHALYARWNSLCGGRGCFEMGLLFLSRPVVGHGLVLFMSTHCPIGRGCAVSLRSSQAFPTQNQCNGSRGLTEVFATELETSFDNNTLSREDREVYSLKNNSAYKEMCRWTDQALHHSFINDGGRRKLL